MIDRRLLFESLGISVVDFRCRAHVEPDGPEEPNATHSIVFVRRGVFRRTDGGETFTADANHVLFFNAAQPYRYAHPLPGGDDCTILALDKSLALEIVARHAPADAARPETPFRLGYGLASPRAARLHYELFASVRRQSAPAAGTGRASPSRCEARLTAARSRPRIAIEDALVGLADEAVRSAYATQTLRTAPSSRSSAVRRRRRDLVEAAKLILNERVDSPPSLGALARALACSPFHLSRTFREVAGVSLRRYLGRLRTRLAAEQLADGAPDLTRLALELGYADHSHFTNAFRKEWGIPPSAFRSVAKDAALDALAEDWQTAP